MDDQLEGRALYLHTQHCAGCDDCRGRKIPAAAARAILRPDVGFPRVRLQPCDHGRYTPLEYCARCSL